ncbi:Gfo/Idh/MocA family protein [Poriferisphaera sp. WC338]|uniref:Gfo/Idh/MocA family protein n=1 Tax=Poriferisphaera sp. WC338 TaxID=3425129 RepID=UPI003D81C0C6
MTQNTDRKIRYGILATGNIARQFAEGINDGATLSSVQAVASRSADKAQTFATKHNIPTAHPNYDALLNDPNVDAIYNATPNNLHHEWTIRALNAGKHVLCEKPFSLSSQQTEEMFAAAEQNNRLLAEAFMYFTHPLTQAYLEQIRQGAIGRPKLIRASFSYAAANPDTNSRFSTELAGGSLMDIGCYCVTLALLVAQSMSPTASEPSKITCEAHLHPTGIDDYAAATLRFPNQLIVSFTCGMTAHLNNTTFISGDKGYIEIPIPWKPPVTGATYRIGRNAPPKQDNPNAGKAPTAPPLETFTIDAGKPLYALEADAFADSILTGSSLFITPDFTRCTTRILDELRQQAGLPF